MPTRFTGGCECGAVRYASASKPLMMFICHCRACQITSGGPYVPVVVIPAKALAFTKGTPKYHFTNRVMGPAQKRGFCADCGSRITGGETEKPGRIIAVTASSLDDPSLFVPDHEIFTSHAQAWDLLNSQLSHHREYAPPTPLK